MTAVEWLEQEFIKLESTIGVYGKMYELIEQAKQMEKKQITDSYLIGLLHPIEMDATKQAEEYYNETYGSKGTGVLTEGSGAVGDKGGAVTSSQTEISDEEILDGAARCRFNDLDISVGSFELGARWYREQLKSK